MIKLNDSQKIAVVMLMGANRLLKLALHLKEMSDIALATEQINMSKWILGEEIFNSLINKLDGNDDKLAEDAISQTHELVSLFKETDEEESHDEI